MQICYFPFGRWQKDDDGDKNEDNDDDDDDEDDDDDDDDDELTHWRYFHAKSSYLKERRGHRLHLTNSPTKHTVWEHYHQFSLYTTTATRTTTTTTNLPLWQKLSFEATTRSPTSPNKLIKERDCAKMTLKDAQIALPVFEPKNALSARQQQLGSRGWSFMIPLALLYNLDAHG